MASAKQFVSRLFDIKRGLRDAFLEKGTDVSNMTFSQYPQALRELKGGGGDAYEDEELVITENDQTIVAPYGVRYTPIKVSVPKPTLNAPTISLNANGGYLNVSDYNGNFVGEYHLCINGEEKATFTKKQIAMSEYGIGATDEVSVYAAAKLFNTSPLSNVLFLEFELNGTVGLTYAETENSASCTGYGTATDTDILIASIYKGKPVTAVGQGAFSGNSKIISVTLSNSVTTLHARALNNCANLETLILGSDCSEFADMAFANCQKLTLVDCRNVKQVPKALTTNVFINSVNVKFVIPDELYDEWKSATNWVQSAHRLVLQSDYEAQQGGTV